MPFFIEKENATNKLHYSNDDGEAQNRSQKMDCELIRGLTTVCSLHCHVLPNVAIIICL